jgi:Uma2 family endonuclease
MLSLDEQFEPIAMTEAEYLAFERTAEARHEYRNGIVYEVPGSSYWKSRIGVHIRCALSERLDRKDAHLFGCDIRVHIRASGWYVYPDCSVVRGRLEMKRYVDDDNLLNPCLVVGVYTPSTEDYDREDKFNHYKTIPSLAHYVIASQEKPLVEVFTRQADGSWSLEKYEAGQKFVLPALECEIEVDQIYANVFDVVPEYVSVD